MIRPTSNSPRFRQIRSRLRQKLERLMGDRPRPVRMERIAQPQVRSLESRFVLDATAVLAGMELTVTGDIDAETLTLEVDQTTGNIQLFDENNDVVEIVGNPDGELNPLDPANVSSISFDMGGGDDILNLQMPSGIDVTVATSVGTDLTHLTFFDDPVETASIHVVSDEIHLQPSSPSILLSSDTVSLSGDVHVADATLELAGGSLTVDGNFIVDGQVALKGDGVLDLSSATLTSNNASSSLDVQLAGSDVRLGDASDDAGNFVQDVDIMAAQSLQIDGSGFSISGSLNVTGVTGSTTFVSSIEAESVSISTDGDVEVQGTIATRGAIQLETTQTLSVTGDLRTNLDSTAGSVFLSGGSVEFSDLDIVTHGGQVTVDGPVQISDPLSIDTGDAMSASTGGSVDFMDAIEGGVGDSALVIDARGATVSGDVLLQGNVGSSTVDLTATDLGGLEILAENISVHHIGITDGSVELSASMIHLLAPEVTTTGSGSITFNGEVILPNGNTIISSAGDIHFTSTIRGQGNATNLSIDAIGNVSLQDGAESLNDLSISAIGTATLQGSYVLSGKLDIQAANVEIDGGIDTSSSNQSQTILATDQLQITGLAGLTAGAGTISLTAGAIVDVGETTLQSMDVVIADADEVNLGSVTADRLLQLSNVGTVGQQNSTMAVAQQLAVTSSGAVELGNTDNDFEELAITSDGAIVVNDGVGDLCVVGIDSMGSDVTLSTAESLLLKTQAITAVGAHVTLTAGKSILDKDNTSQSNVQSASLEMTAELESIGASANALDVDVAVRVDSDASGGNGNVFLANELGGLQIGEIDAGTGTVTLSANAINDAVGDILTDITAQSITLEAIDGVGNTQALELDGQQISAMTVSGNIDLSNQSSSNTDVALLKTSSGTIRFAQSGGGDVTFSGDVANGNPGDGQSITLTASNGLTLTGGVSSELGNGGTLEISGATIQGSVSVGAGDVVIQGGDLDLVISESLSAQNDIHLSAERDVVIDAIVEASSGGRITVVADSNLSSDLPSGNDGGVLLLADGQLIADGAIAITGSSLFSPLANGETVLVASGVASEQVLAGGDISILQSDNAPSGAAIGIEGVLRTLGSNSQVTLDSHGDVRLGGDARISAIDGRIRVDADQGLDASGGEFFMSDLAQIVTQGGEIQVAADGDITLSSLKTQASVELGTRSGLILDGGDSAVDIVAKTLAMRSALGIGTAVDAIETETAVAATSLLLAAKSDAGDVHVEHTGQLMVGQALLSGTTITGVVTVNDQITLCADTILLEESIDAGSGDIRLQASTGEILQAAGTLHASGLGVSAATSIALVSVGNSVDTFAARATSTIEFSESDGFTVGEISAYGCFSSVVSGVEADDIELCVDSGDLILDATLSTSGTARLHASNGNVTQTIDGDIQANTLGVVAANSIDLGVTSNDVVVFAAESTANGPVRLADVNGLAVGMVNAGNCFPNDVVGVTTMQGDIALRTIGGNLLVGEQVSAGGSGNILLESNQDIVTNADVTSQTGHLDLSADGNLQINSQISTTGLGAVFATANDMTVSVNGGVATVDGDVLLHALGDLTLDGEVESAGTGGISLKARDDIAINASVSTVSGDISLEAENHLQDGDPLDGVVMSVATSITTLGGNVLAIAFGDGDLRLSLIETETGSISLDAGDDVVDVDQDEQPNLIGNELAIRAGGQIGASDVAGPRAPTVNVLAIDTSVETLSARATGGIYLQESNGVIVGEVAELSASFNANVVNFDLSVMQAVDDASLAELEDLVSSSGPVKLVAESGEITIEPGSDLSFGISAGGDILLEARGAGNDVIVNGNIQSDSGHVTLTAVDDLDLNGSLSTGGDGTVYLHAGNDQADAVGLEVDGINLDGSITTLEGDVLIDSSESIRQTASISSTGGDVGLVAFGAITQESAGDITTTSGDVLIDAGGDWAMDGATVVSSGGQDLLGRSGGTITLGVLRMTDVTANRVALEAVSDILDANDSGVNIEETDSNASTSVSLRAGGIIGVVGGAVEAVNDNAIDLNVDEVAAVSSTGIYLREVASGGAITVTSVDAVSVTIETVQRSDFDSGTSDVSLPTVSLEALEDLQTTTAGPIKLVAEGGSITIESGSDAAFGVSAAGASDVLLEARGNTSDVTVNGNVQSDGGHITIDAGRDVALNANITTTTDGTVVILSGGDTSIDSSVTTVDGDVLVDAGGSITQISSITVTNGDVGLVAGGNIEQGPAGDITTTSGDVLIEAGGDWRMDENTIIEVGGQDLLGISGGTITLGLLRMTDGTANRIALEAALDILDANAADVNIEETIITAETTLNLRSGGVIGGAGLTSSSTNDAALDLIVDVVAASSVLGIYLREVASGNGDIRVDMAAAVSVDVEGVVRSNFNSTTTDASQDASLAELEDLVSSSGPVKLVAESGEITIEPGSDLSFGISAGGDILLEARGVGSDVIVNGNIQSDSGHVTLTAVNDLDLNGSLSTGGDGTVYLHAGNDQADAVGLEVDGINLDGSITTLEGDVLIDSSESIRQTASISSTGGDVGLVAIGTITQESSGDITTTSGDVLIDAGSDWTMDGATVIEAGGQDLLGRSGGTITLGVLRMTDVTANRVALEAASDILDANDSGVNIEETDSNASTSVSLRAGGIIGVVGGAVEAVNDNAIDLNVDEVAAVSSTGIYLREVASGGAITVTSVDAVSVTIETVQRSDFDSGTSDVSLPTVSLEALEDLQTTTAGPIKLVAEGGSITIESGSDAAFGVSAAGASDVLLEARGNTSDVTVNGNVQSDGGHITIDAGRDVAMNANITTATDGTVVILSGGDTSIDSSVTTVDGDVLVDAGGSITQISSITVTNGDVGLVAGGNIEQGPAGDITTTSGDVLIEAGGDWRMDENTIIEVGGQDLLGISGGTITLGLLRMTDGTANRIALEAALDILDANAADVNIEETIITAETTLNLRSGGTIGQADVVNPVESSVTAIDLHVDVVSASSGTGIYLREVAEGGDLLIDQTSGVVVDVEGVVRSNFNSTTTDASRDQSLQSLENLTTTINGEIEVVVVDGNLVVADGVDSDGPDLKDDPEIIASGENGRVDLRTLAADSVIELQDNVQIQAEKVTAEYAEPSTRPMPEDLGLLPEDRAVYMKANGVMFGEDIEIFTGENQGTARIFSPRPPDYIVNEDGTTTPIVGGLEPAFYTADSVRTTVLTQADVNNATGILTVDLGQEGERGLTIDIDWGAITKEYLWEGETRRFQQINGLSADDPIFVDVNGIGQPTQPVVGGGGAPVLNVKHFYTESDLIESRENGRQSATDPIELRFSVRHHESIFVEAFSVTQSPIGNDLVPGGVVTTTDNPLTPRDVLPGLENGQQRFIIPALSIPVAFFPVREVVPELEVPEFEVRSEPRVLTQESSVESVVTSGFATVGRDEYFQIRALSPDPGGEDLALERLPDDILEGDKIKQLLQALPDGSYEIEYVLGDTVARSILRVDVRGGEATIPGEELDEGILRLKEYDPAEFESFQEEAPTGIELDQPATDEAAGNLLEFDEATASLLLRRSAVELGVSAANGSEIEQHNVPMDQMGDMLTPIGHEEPTSAAVGAPLAGAVVASALQRKRLRRQRKRLSVASRFSARRRQMGNPPGEIDNS